MGDRSPGAATRPSSQGSRKGRIAEALRPTAAGCADLTTLPPVAAVNLRTVGRKDSPPSLTAQLPAPVQRGPAGYGRGDRTTQLIRKHSSPLKRIAHRPFPNADTGAVNDHAFQEKIDFFPKYTAGHAVLSDVLDACKSMEVVIAIEKWAAAASR